MTPSEAKARALGLSFLQITQDFEKAKQCALIAVEEIIKEIGDLMFSYDIDLLKDSNYWNQVKTEIEKL